MKAGKNGRVGMMVLLLPESHRTPLDGLPLSRCESVLWGKRQIHTFREENEI